LDDELSTLTVRDRGLLVEKYCTKLPQDEKLLEKIVNHLSVIEEHITHVNKVIIVSDIDDLTEKVVEKVVKFRYEIITEKLEQLFKGFSQIFSQMNYYADEKLYYEI
jgi:hypothetical protein